MGFMDTIKKFFGWHGVTTEFTRIEKQDPTGEVTFPITDSVMKANIQINSAGPGKILSTTLKFMVMHQTETEGQKRVVFGEDSNTSGTFADEIPFPHEMSGGDSIKDGFIITGVDIPAKLEKLGFPDFNAAINDPSLEFYLLAEVDVEGSPFDPEAKKHIKLLPA